MKISINDRRKIGGIQKEFSLLFPYLKLEFFPKPSTRDGGTLKKTIINPSKTLGECRTVHKSGTIDITPGMTVNDLTNYFRDIYGLEIQLLRNSGKIWLETTLTENWTLEEQNRQGESLNK